MNRRTELLQAAADCLAHGKDPLHLSWLRPRVVTPTEARLLQEDLAEGAHLLLDRLGGDR